MRLVRVIQNKTQEGKEFQKKSIQGSEGQIVAEIRWKGSTKVIVSQVQNLQLH